MVGKRKVKTNCALIAQNVGLRQILPVNQNQRYEVHMDFPEVKFGVPSYSGGGTRQFLLQKINGGMINEMCEILVVCDGDNADKRICCFRNPR